MRRATREELRLLDEALADWRGYQIPNGIPKRFKLNPIRLLKEGLYDRDQMAIGTKVELEHTSSPEIALEIALAHLYERDDYYELLEKMEHTPRQSGRRPRRGS
jgi:hypothetical protein